MGNDYLNIDSGLEGMLGGRYSDETASKEKNTTPATNAAQKPIESVWLDNIAECAKPVAIYGGLMLLIWYWLVAGLVDATVAVPCMCVCTALIGFGIGRNSR